MTNSPITGESSGARWRAMLACAKCRMVAPVRDPQRFPVCPRCKELAIGRGL